MNAKTLRGTLCFGIAAALSLPIAGTAIARQTINAVEANANVSKIDVVGLLSRATGLTERQVKLELGKRTAWADYAITYDSGDGHFRQAVGYEVYHDLKTQGVLTPQDVQHLTAMAAKRHAEQVASVK
ncbi:MAG: hypothetical protein ACREPJ_13450 [Rhodanobacteraceae bacterium]